MANSSTSPPRFTDRSVAFRPAEPEDDEGIRQLLSETPFGQRISMTLEPDPASQPPLADPDRSHTVVATRFSAPHAILGLAERSVHAVWLNGCPARTGYLGQLRRKPGEKITFRRLREGFHLLERHRLPDETPFDFTSILSQNTTTRRLLERGLPGLPRYEPAGEMITLTFTASRAARHGSGNVRPVRREEREEVLAFARSRHRLHQFAPVLDGESFDLPGIEWFASERADRIAGCVALWDQGSFKSVTTQGYVPWLGRLRIPINIARSVVAAPPLPRPGSTLPLAFLSFLAVDPGDHETVNDLIAAAGHAARQRSLHLLHLGLPANHPAIPGLRKALRPEITSSVIYLVDPPSAPPPDEGRPTSKLPVHPEIALL